MKERQEMELSDEYAEAVARVQKNARKRAELKAQLKELDEQDDEYLGTIKQALGDEEEATFGGAVIVRHSIVVSNVLDQKLLREKFPDLRELLTKRSVSHRYSVVIPE